MNEALTQTVAKKEKYSEYLIMNEMKMKARTMLLSCGIELYKGNYFNSQFGDLTVSLEEGILVASLGTLRSEMTPYTKPNTMRVELISGSGKVMEFISDEECTNVSGLNYMGVEWKRKAAK